jgi:hypothetical protein
VAFPRHLRWSRYSLRHNILLWKASCQTTGKGSGIGRSRQNVSSFFSGAGLSYCNVEIQAYSFQCITTSFGQLLVLLSAWRASRAYGFSSPMILMRIWKIYGLYVRIARRPNCWGLQTMHYSLFLCKLHSASWGVSVLEYSSTTRTSACVGAIRRLEKLGQQPKTATIEATTITTCRPNRLDFEFLQHSVDSFIDFQWGFRFWRNCYLWVLS